ncbi:hypothetical protein [Flexivirga alba]|uniref:Uncharacterized protein n=1 Tax=Flexivirga alba TaxID=702742 RepID=A0ABW2ABX6_9MICO
MNPSEQHDQDDLERRLRDAFAAKALQISDADLDRDREDDVAATLSSRRRSSPASRIFAGVGAAAAAAAIVVVTVVGLHNDGKHEVVNGLQPATTTSSSSTTPSTTTSTQEPTGAGKPSALNQPGTPGNDHPTTGASTASSTPSSETTSSLSPNRTALSGSSTVTSNSSTSSLSAESHEPPAMSAGLPQSGRLGDQEYTGAVPLKDPSGGKTRMLAMPSDTTWQRTAEGGSSLTVRITYLPTDIEAYWRKTLPGEGWIENGSGWSYPSTSYTVSAITDKGSFTVTW